MSYTSQVKLFKITNIVLILKLNIFAYNIYIYIYNLVLSILNYFNLNYSFIESVFLAEIYLFPKGVNNMKQFIKRIIFLNIVNGQAKGPEYQDKVIRLKFKLLCKPALF